MNLGLLVPKAFAADADVPAADADYVRDVTARYGLSAAQERTLRLVLQNAREEELAIYTTAETAQLPPSLRARVLAVRSRTEQRIRALLDDGQRARFDADSRPQEAR
ncbi:MAG: hypothetical protein KF830_03505 [Planctomycetes bacterium]|nr:hypothetical protein [Planctomycetota bacterium]